MGGLLSGEGWWFYDNIFFVKFKDLSCLLQQMLPLWRLLLKDLFRLAQHFLTDRQEQLNYLECQFSLELLLRLISNSYADGTLVIDAVMIARYNAGHTGVVLGYYPQ